ncbi:MAG: Ger(x)C family spore germination protein [Bacillota bacterium]
MSRRWWQILTGLLLCSTLLTGCWSRKELQELVFVSTIGIDWNEESQRFDLTVEVVRALYVPRPGERPGGSPQERPYHFVHISGRTASEAMLQLQRTRSRRVHLSHVQVLLFGQEAARRSMADALDYIWRFHQTRPYIDVVIARGSARELLAGRPTQGDLTGRWIATMLEQSDIHGHAHTSPLYRVMYEIVTPGTAPVVPVLSLRRTGTPDPENVPSFLEFQVDGVALLQRDRMVRLLGSAESRGLLLARGDLRSTVVTAPTPESEEEYLSVVLERAKARIQVGQAAGEGLPPVRLRVHAVAEFEQRQRLPEPVPSQVLRRMEQVISRHLQEEIEGAIAATQAAGVDGVGFGEALRRANPRLWHRYSGRWEEWYPELPVTVEVTVMLKRTGLLR